MAELTSATLPDQLRASGHRPREFLAIVDGPSDQVGLAWDGGSALLRQPIASVVAALADLEPRWVWWNARDTATAAVAAGVRADLCWDIGAVAMLTEGTRRDDAGSAWAAAHGLALPPPPAEALDLFDIDHTDDGPLRDGQLNPEWLAGGWTDRPDRVRRWAELAFELATKQRTAVGALDDPRRATDGAPLRTLIAFTHITNLSVVH